MERHQQAPHSPSLYTEVRRRASARAPRCLELPAAPTCRRQRRCWGRAACTLVARACPAGTRKGTIRRERHKPSVCSGKLASGFFSACEESVRSSFGQGWLELPIFDCRLLIVRRGSCPTTFSIDNRQSAIGNRPRCSTSSLTSS